jgi:hypothetical protein
MTIARRKTIVSLCLFVVHFINSMANPNHIDLAKIFTTIWMEEPQLYMVQAGVGAT